MQPDAGFGLAGRRILVTGAASGIGAATAQHLDACGAEVIGVDIAGIDPDGAAGASCTRTAVVDMSDPASIDAVLGDVGELDGLCNVAGVPGTFEPLHVLAVNFLGLRHLTDRTLERLRPGGAVASVASLAGRGWAEHVRAIDELRATGDFAAGRAWCAEHYDPALHGDAYAFSKECVIVDTHRRARDAVRAGHRVNCVSPGPVATPMMPAFRATVGGPLIDWMAAQTAERLAQPEEVAAALVFLVSPAASFVNGHELVVDGGFNAAMASGHVDFSSLPA